jgi:hypothetical protein
MYHEKVLQVVSMYFTLKEEQIENVWEQVTEENIWTQGGWNRMKMEKNT